MALIAGQYNCAQRYSTNGSSNQLAYGADSFSDNFSNPFGNPTYVAYTFSIYAIYTPTNVCSLVTQVHPSDAQALKLNVEVTTGGGSGYSATFTGQDKDGNSQTETLDLSGTGTFTTTKWFKSIDTGGVAVTVPSGGSITLSVTQNQWGTVWKNAANQFRFDAALSIGDGSTETYFVDVNKQVMFSNMGKTTNLKVHSNATFQLGTMIDAAKKTTKDGCCLTFGDSTKSGANYDQFTGSASSTVYLYSSMLVDAGTGEVAVMAIQVTGGA